MVDERSASDKGGRSAALGRRLHAAARALHGRQEPAASPPAEQTVPSLEQAIDTLTAAPIEEVQRRGYHFQERDFYSALNDLRFLADNHDLWHDRPLPAGHRLGPRYAAGGAASNIAPLSGAGRGAGRDAARPPSYHWHNHFWRGADALVQYGLLRSVRPRRVVEIGCGWSSLLLAEALRRNEEEGAPAAVVDQVEPYPRGELLSALPESWTLHETILQRADPHLFESLDAGDVCFYDGSHVARAGSDVVWFFFEVLPRLKPGVLVHVHDVFWPGDYPDEWIFSRGQTWNEQYVLQAFLMYNREFEPLICNSALFRCRSEALEELYRETQEMHTGSSVWLRRLPR